MGDPPSGPNFPVLNTILSIPFSLLHNLPRLTALAPLSTYQQNLAIMALEIEKLWWWDPPPKLIEESLVIRAKNMAYGQQSDLRTARPHPIYHSSRSSVTYRARKPRTSFVTDDAMPSNNDQYIRTIELPHGQVLVGTALSVTLGTDGLALTPDEDDGTKEIHVPPKSSASGISPSIWDTGTFGTVEDFEEDMKDLKPITHPIRPCSADINSWYVHVFTSCSGTETLSPPPLVPSPFQGGALGGMRTNDILMIKGLLHPSVFIEFFDLRSPRFNCLL